jgi:DNA-binding CsgD family transcriptional regulator
MHVVGRLRAVTAQIVSDPIAATTRENPRVGRDREWQQLTRHLNTGAVALAGDPGMGKSTLLGALAGHHPRVLAGRVGEFERSIPFGVFVDALGEHWTLDLGADLTAAGRHSLHREVRSLLHDLGDVLLVLDDLHWADAASLDLLHHLVRHRPPHTKIACGVRPRQLQIDCMPVVALGPLTRDEARELLGAPVSKALYDESGGNPFYLETLAGGSEALQAALRGEMSALAPRTARLLQVAAVIGDQFEAAVVAEIAGQEVDQALTALDDLIAADLIRHDQRAYRFRHPTVRNAAYHSAPVATRHRAHTRAATVLERLGAPAEARAHHVELAATPGDRHAVGVLSAAASSVMHKAPATAAQWYATALSLSADDEWELRWGHARALGLSGRLQDSRTALHDLLAVLPKGHRQRLDVVAFCAHVERALGLHAEVRALAARELESMPDNAVLKLVLAVSLLQVMESAETIASLVADVREIARRDGDAVLEAGAAAVASLSDGDAARLEFAASAVDGATDQDVARRLESVVWLAWSELRLGRFRESLRHYERALAVAHATGQHHMLGNLLLGAANALRWLGCLTQACEGAAEAVEAAFLGGSKDLLALTLSVHSWLLTLRGEHVTGLQVARRAVDVARAIEGWHPTIARLRVGHALLAAGEKDAAADEILSAGGGSELPKVPQAYRAEMYELLVQATGSAEWAEHASTTAEQAGLPGSRGFAELAWAQVHQARGEHAEAEQRAARAVHHFDAAGQRLEEGRARLTRGTALTSLGSRTEGEAELRRAQGLFTVCGAPAPAQDGFDALTSRERQVARLVGEGLTNRQVARQLRMAEKTVEGHLSRIFAKLEVRSRAGVAAQVGRLGR